ncbi:MAG: Smr/MutS family protein [Proteobacteria bacterium]|nr:Smr/MutS family protein [Pseudomonadota bacterium]
MSQDSRTLELLEWPSIQDFLVEACQCDFGKHRASQWTPGLLNSIDESQKMSRAVLELAEFERNTQLKLPLADIQDIEPILKRIERSGSILVEDFATLVRFQRGVHGLFHFLQRYPTDKNDLQAQLFGLDKLEEWCQRHFSLLSPQGEIVDNATEDLFALRKFAKSLHENIKSKLDDFLHNPKQAEILQDRYVTVRQGRYVIPVKTNFRGRAPGIIHDLSKTESTLFIEPEDVVDANNKLKVAEKEIEIEIERILTAVVQNTQPFVSQLRSNLEILTRADLLSAGAKLVAQWSGDICTASWDRQGFDFTKLRHPLLSLRENVIPNTLAWDKGFVLTGPNTGGKTVLLKSVGLAYCLAKAGLPVPSKTAHFPEAFDKILVDIGDEQDLEKDLSSFSGHVNVLNDFLKNSDSKTLILIDEIATSTSPEEGECLAQAVLEAFLDKKASFFITTHFGRLKNFAMNDKRCRIAAMAFNSKTRQPTYEIILDVPGESSALDTAERLGLSHNIVERARALRGNSSFDFSQAVLRLEESRKKYEEKELELAKEKTLAQEEWARAELKRKEYQEKLHTQISQDSREMLKELQTLKKELSESVKNATKEDLQSGGQKLFNQLSDTAEKIRKNIQNPGLSDTQPLTPEDGDYLKIGNLVDISGLGMGKVIDHVDTTRLTPNTLILVQVGELKTRVSLSRIRKPQSGQADHFRSVQEAQAAAAQRNSSKLTLSSNASKDGPVKGSICDVRGKVVDEAMIKIEAALNELLRNEASSVTIIHGHGSEKLKDAIRQHLTLDRPDLKFRPGSWPGEGGDGVTVVELDV